MAFEIVILKAIYGLVGASGFLDGLFVFCARFLVYISTLIFVAELLVHREPYERLTKIFYTGFALILSAGIFQAILGYLVIRATPALLLSSRPLLEGVTSFPAFATTWAVSIAVIGFIIVSKRLGAWLFALALIIGFAQLYTGLYWPLDVAVSLGIGIAGPLIARRFIPPTRS